MTGNLKLFELKKLEDTRMKIVIINGCLLYTSGDIRNIRREKDLGHRTNQKFHSLPYNRIYIMLEYKLKRYGIRFTKQEESYTSQCSPLSPEVGKRYAEPSKRKERGLYRLSLIHILLHTGNVITIKSDGYKELYLKVTRCV